MGVVSNLILILEQDPALSGIVACDEFLAASVLMRAPPVPLDTVPPAGGPYPRTWRASDVSYIQSYIQRTWCKSAARTEVEEAMHAVAEMHRFHPVKDWLATLVWDGTSRLDGWLTNAFGAPDDDYHAAAGAAFLIAAVKRVRQPGIKFDHMPILEGKQALGKSTAIRTLFGAPWFTDALPAALESRDAALGLQGVWVIEFAEIEHLIRADVEVIKAFLSRSVDRFRAPYGRQFLTYPRQCVVIGTTNDNDYLRDSTGNRRFWPVRCEHVDLEWIEANRGQLWAEAAAREASGEAHWLTETDAKTEAAAAQHARLQDDVWEEKIEPRLRHRILSVTMGEVLSEFLTIPTERQDRRTQLRAATVLRKLGWERVTERSEGKLVKTWKRAV
jgi:predicted P-loop ATPase